MMESEILVYALAAGQTERYTEELLSTRCKTRAEVERVKEAASADGYHSFRVALWDGSPPDFRTIVKRA